MSDEQTKPDLAAMRALLLHLADDYAQRPSDDRHDAIVTHLRHYRRAWIAEAAERMEK